MDTIWFMAIIVAVLGTGFPLIRREPEVAMFRAIWITVGISAAVGIMVLAK